MRRNKSKDGSKYDKWKDKEGISRSVEKLIKRKEN